MKISSKALFFSSIFFLCLPSMNGGEFFHWVALVPLLFFLQEKLSLKKHAVLLWGIGFCFLLFQYQMLWALLPLDWVGIPGTVSGSIVVFLIWLLLAGFLAIPFLLLLPLRKYIFLAPILWPLQEFIRSLLYSLLTWSGSSVLGDVFTYGFLGLSAHASAFLLSLAPYLHLYGMSAFFVLGNYFFFLLLKSKEKKVLFVAGIILGVLFFVEFFAPPIHESAAPGKTLNVVTLQGNNPVMFGYGEDYFKNLVTHYTSGIQNALRLHPETDVVVVPEASQLLRILAARDGRALETHAQELLGSDRPRTILYGDYDDDKNISLVVGISNNKNEIPQESEKLLLMPLGEYQPAIVLWAGKVLGKKEWLEEILYYRNLKLPERSGGMIRFHNVSFAPVACSEVFAGPIYRHIKNENADVIVHFQRLASFHGDRHVYEEGLRVSQFRAAELGKPIIGSVDGSGYSYIIDKMGKIVVQGNKDSAFVYGSISY